MVPGTTIGTSVLYTGTDVLLRCQAPKMDNCLLAVPDTYLMMEVPVISAGFSSPSM